MSDLWQTLLADMSNTQNPLDKTEQGMNPSIPISEAQQPQQTNPALNQYADQQANRIANPQLLNQVEHIQQTPLVQLPNFLPPIVQPQSLVQQQPAIQLTEVNDDVPFDADDEDDDDELAVLNALINPQVLAQQTNQVMQSIFPQATPQVDVNQIAVKRGRGRPPKVQSQDNVFAQLNQTVMNQPANVNESLLQQELGKSNQPGIPTANQSGKDIVVAIPKATCKEIGESLLRIGSAFISISQS